MDPNNRGIDGGDPSGPEWGEEGVGIGMARVGYESHNRVNTQNPIPG